MSVEAEKLSSYDSIDEIGYLMGGGGGGGGEGGGNFQVRVAQCAAGTMNEKTVRTRKGRRGLKQELR